MIPTDIKSYLSASRPDDDVSLTGGAVDALCVLIAAQLAANDVLRVVSDNVADNQTVTITGRNAAGDIVADPIVLNGTNVAVGALTFERVIKIDLSAVTAGDITIERNTNPYDDVVVMPAGKTSAAIQFISSTSESAQTVRAEKAAFKNENGVQTLTSASITLTADPSASVRIAVESAKNDVTTIANRKATPTGVTFTDDGISAAVPGNQLETGSSISYWAEFTRGADAAAIKTTYTVQIDGVAT